MLSVTHVNWGLSHMSMCSRLVNYWQSHVMLSQSHMSTGGVTHQCVVLTSSHMSSCQSHLSTCGHHTCQCIALVAKSQAVNSPMCQPVVVTHVNA